MGTFSFQGQVCFSLLRVYLLEDRYDEKFVAAAKLHKLGDSLDAETRTCPR
ncbi:aldehyde dehydrogenase family protein [Paenibacillus elgii]|uniref:aldehyde dehydrogenase family protein n=1 Tax=Paenibacillus elgii TaxID=189691 RepID=UPI0026C302D1